LDELIDGAGILHLTFTLKVRDHLAGSKLPHTTELNFTSTPTGLQMETSSRDAKNESRILPIISSVKYE